MRTPRVWWKKASLLSTVVLLQTVSPAARGAEPRQQADGGRAAATAELLLETEACGGKGTAPCPQIGGDSDGRGPEGAGPNQESAREGLTPVGSRAAPFVLPDLKGKAVTFDPGSGGRAALVVFWSMFCEPCREDLPFIEGVARNHEKAGLTVLTVNVDGAGMAEAVGRYLTLDRLGVPVVLDRKVGKKLEIASAYGVTGTPSLFLIGSDGLVLWSHAGRVDPTAFEEQLARALVR